MSDSPSGAIDELDIDKLMNQSGRLDLADKAILMADQAQNLRTSREVVRAHHRRHLPEFQDSEDEAMQIVLGDINYAAPPAASVLPVSQSGTDCNPGSPAKTSPVKSAGALAKLVAGAALVASGAGAGVGIPLLLSGGKDVVEQVTKPTQQATSETSATDAAGSAGKAVRYVLELGK